ncbi:MAG: aspartate kinase, partial [Flavobacteriaceae bacterium]|nr:aspartate kinase [Flavobacteriaceae bacterium]
MKIYKFGGASVKDAEGVRNLHRVLRETEAQNTLLVVSAMGKMTNAMEEVVRAQGSEERESAIQVIYNFHRNIVSDLFMAGH